MEKIIFGLFIASIFFTSCSPKLTPFTQRLYKENDWTESELKRIQFYLSEDIVLRRDAESSRSRIQDGEIKVINGGEMEKVVIRRGTPGVFVFSPKADRFAISFERGDDRYLMFGPNPKANNRYLLLASEWKKRGGMVTYGGKRYRVENEDAYATIMVDLKKVRKVAVKSRTADGRKVN
ncbi:MAG: hypothetical protein AAF849_16550 [Bacteroidota bacterium]